MVADVLNCLPTPSKVGKPETSMVNIERLKLLACFKLATPLAQSQLAAVLKMLGRLVDNRDPAFHEIIKDDVVLADFTATFQHFVRLDAGHGDGVETGAPALKISMASALANKEVGTLKETDVTELNTYSWLLDSSDRAKLQVLNDDLKQSLVKSAPSRKRGSGESSSSAKPHEDNAAASALAFFKKKRPAKEEA